MSELFHMAKRGIPSVSVCLIGCGAVSEILYAPALVAMKQKGLLEPVAVVDPNSSRTESVGQKLPSASCYADIDNMLAHVIPDLAIIAAPHKFHADLALTCFRHGVHVLCEKPMAITKAECEHMIDAAETAGCLLGVGHFRRFFPSCELIKTILDRGLLGAVRSFQFLEGETYSWPAQSTSFFHKSSAGGGVLIDAGAHTMDLLIWWLGEVADLDYQDDAMGGVEANCRMRLKMAIGAEGIVQLSRDWPLPNRYVINCDKGWIAYVCDVVDRIEWGWHHADYGLDSRIFSLPRLGAARALGLSQEVSGFMDCFASQLRNFVGAIRGQEPLRVPGSEAVKSVELIERCYLNRKFLAMPWLSETENEKGRRLAIG